jgi:hypothetical protein
MFIVIGRWDALSGVVGASVFLALVLSNRILRWVDVAVGKRSEVEAVKASRAGMAGLAGGGAQDAGQGVSRQSVKE